MERRITVKGTGQVRRKPDQVILDLRLEALDLSYEKAMALAARSLEELRLAVQGADFDPKELKTTSFDIDVRYRSEQDAKNHYIQIFEGYAVNHGIRLEFDWDQDRLGKVLTAVAKTRINPGLDIRFGIKDPNAVVEELLALAAENARQKAQILAAASGVALGELQAIDYNWSDIHLYSNTNFMMRDKMMMEAASAPSIEPEDVSVSDSATFVWAIR